LALKLIEKDSNMNAVTKFLNVDLDLCGDTGDLNEILRSIETSVVVLSHADQEASVELAKEFSSLEQTVTALIELIDALQPKAKSIWNRLEFRRLNVGIQAAREPHAAFLALSAKAVESLAALQFEIFLTVYAPLAD
jgi:hypothetical protein